MRRLSFHTAGQAANVVHILMGDNNFCELFERNRFLLKSFTNNFQMTGVTCIHKNHIVLLVAIVE